MAPIKKMYACLKSKLQHKVTRSAAVWPPTRLC